MKCPYCGNAVDFELVRPENTQWRGEPATENQIGWLRDFAKIDGKGMTKGEASQEIDRVKKEKGWA